MHGEIGTVPLVGQEGVQLEPLEEQRQRLVTAADVSIATMCELLASILKQSVKKEITKKRHEGMEKRTTGFGINRLVAVSVLQEQIETVVAQVKRASMSPENGLSEKIGRVQTRGEKQKERPGKRANPAQKSASTRVD